MLVDADRFMLIQAFGFSLFGSDFRVHAGSGLRLLMLVWTFGLPCSPFSRAASGFRVEGATSTN